MNQPSVFHTRFLNVVSSRCVCVMLLAVAGMSLPQARGADFVQLSAETWDQFVPLGKEVDCIYGDFVLKNDRLAAVIANPIKRRNANMTVRNVGGGIIDLTRLDHPSDQLSAYYPGGQSVNWRKISPSAEQGKKITLTLRNEPAPGEAAMTLTYTLEDGSDVILVETKYANLGDKPLEVELLDQMRADKGFDKVPNGQTPLFWVYDKWWGQAYGLACETHPLHATSDARLSTVRFSNDGKSKATIPPKESLTVRRKIFPAKNMLDVQAVASTIVADPSSASAAIKLAPLTLSVADTTGKKLSHADVEVFSPGESGKIYASGRTDEKGILKASVPAGEWNLKVSYLGISADLAIKILEGQAEKNTFDLILPACGRVAATITNEQGKGTPCKVQFIGREGTKAPFFFPDTGERAVHNVYYSHNGRFEQDLPPGKYDVIIGYGPEHDAIYTSIAVEAAKKTPLSGKLIRTVNTQGWISADFHNHSSPSGDNTSSQLGRVLNILCEQVEFAPCTEHNRLSTYMPHIKHLQVEHLLATCTGIELTNNPGDVNHQNAFPLIEKPRTQDGGGPLTDDDPEVQIQRLALWDNNSEKLVQQNHPDIGHVFFDKNADGQPDGGFKKSLPFMDVIEVHPIHTVLQPATLISAGKTRNNTVVNWLQLLNQGHRLRGVVNTDSHYNFHESGFLRNYLKCSTDDPSKIETLEIVHSAERGHSIMTSAPFMQVALAPAEAAQNKSFGPGDAVALPKGEATLSVKVQCANWYDIDRVQVLINGRPDETLNFTREKSPGRFRGGVVKFEHALPLKLKGDAHVIVVAIGEKMTLEAVLGGSYGKSPPVAVSNPIFVDVDGGGFKANGDTLGYPLPVAGGRPAPTNAPAKN